MRDLIFCLGGERCADGVELIRRDNPLGVKSLSYGKAGSIWFSWRSNRHERVVRQATSLEDPLVTRFLNASNDDKRTRFLSTFGLPEGFLLGVPGSKKGTRVRQFSLDDVPEGWVLGAPDIGLPAEPRNFVLAMQRRLGRLLGDAASGNAARKDKAAQRALRLACHDSRPTALGGSVALTVPTLTAFMCFEIYMMIENSAHSAKCKRCGDLFLYGKGTERRSTGTYCSAACRVGWHRAIRQKGAEDVS